MTLARALRISNTTRLALVGAGGKTTALFQLARELPSPLIVTTTTHLHADQRQLADRFLMVKSSADLVTLKENLHGVILITGPLHGDRLMGLDGSLISWLCDFCDNFSLPLLIEADGSRLHPLKAPADHEPVIPQFVDTVVVVAGMSGLGKPLTGETVHRPEIFSRLSGLPMGETITPQALARVLTHPAGGLKSIPAGARRLVLLNQSDTPQLQSIAQDMAGQLLPSYHSVIIASLDQRSSLLDQHPKIHAVCEPVAGIVLAAGESRRFGRTKQLLDWRGKPFIRHVAEAALASGLSPVVVVTGANAQAVEAPLHGLPITIQHNPSWQNGQSSSLQAGLRALPIETAAAIFLLADQPQVTPLVLRALVACHSLNLSPIVAPQVQGQRANPVLFDRVTFPELMALTGDVGGRMVFSKFPVTFLPWHDENLLADIDTPEDYRNMVNGA